MNTYDQFKIELFIENLNDNDLLDVMLENYDDDDYLSEDDCDFLNEFLNNDFENQEMINEKSYLKKVLGGGRRIRKKDLKKIKTLQSDGKGGVKSLSASRRHQLKKMSKKAWKRGGRKSSSKKNLVSRKTKKTKRKKGGEIS